MKDGIHPNGYAVTNKQTNAARPDQEHDGRGVGNGAIMCTAEFIKK